MSQKYLFVLIFCAIAELYAVDTRAENLMQIYQRALQNDPVIREAEAVYMAEVEAKPQARSNVLPSLSFSAGAGTSHAQDPNRPTNFATGEVDPDILYGRGIALLIGIPALGGLAASLREG